MGLREHLLARAPYVRAGDKVVGHDLGAILRRLLVFETFALESSRLDELAGLIQAIGFDPAVELLEEGRLSLIAEKGGVGPTLRSDYPPMSFGIGSTMSNGKLRRSMDNLHHRLDLQGLAWTRLEAAIEGAVLMPSGVEDARFGALYHLDASSATYEDIERRDGIVEHIVRIVLRHDLGLDEGAALPFHLDWSKQLEYFTFETDIGHRYNIPDDLVWDLLYRALTALSTLNLRLVQASTFERMVAFSYRDTSLIQTKFQLLLRDVDPAVAESSMTRVLEIGGLPDITADASNVDGYDFLRLCRSKEAIDFRRWLRDLPGRDDESIRAELTSKAERFGATLGTRSGKRARFAVTTAVGFVPVVGNLLGAATGAADSFWLGELENGAVSFLSNGYPAAVQPRATA